MLNLIKCVSCLLLLAIIGVAFTESYLAAFIAPLVNQGFVLPDGTDMPMLIGDGILAQLKYYVDSFQHAIWGTKHKVWVVPLFFLWVWSFFVVFVVLSVLI